MILKHGLYISEIFLILINMTQSLHATRHFAPCPCCL